MVRRFRTVLNSPVQVDRRKAGEPDVGGEPRSRLVASIGWEVVLPRRKARPPTTPTPPDCSARRIPSVHPPDGLLRRSERFRWCDDGAPRGERGKGEPAVRPPEYQ